MVGIARIVSPGLLLLGLWVWGAQAAAAEQDAAFGRWAGPSSILELSSVDGQSLQGKVVALKDPLFKAGDKGPEGQPVTDVNNPDPTRRGVPILGMDLFANYQRKGKGWQGEIYDPESGKTYSSRLRVDKDGELLLRGYIGAPMFGRTERFIPVSRCTNAIRKMLRLASLSGCSGDP